MKEKIYKLKELLYAQLNLDSVDYEKLLEISEELDKVIVEYYEKNNIEEK